MATNRRLDNYMKNKPMQLILYDTLMVIAIISTLIICLIETIMDYEQKGLLVIVCLLIYLIALFVLGNIYPKRVQLFSAMIIAPLNLVFMPYMLIFAEGGGIRSGMPVWLTFGLLVVFLMLRGKLFVLFFVLTVLVDAICFGYSFVYENRIPVVERSAYYYTDNLIAIFTVACSIGVVLKYLALLQKRQKDDIRRAMMEIQTEKQNAETANRAKNRFLANISYDIRTPMNAIIGMTQLTKENLDNPQKATEYLHTAELSSKKLLHMIDNILDISELESGSLYLKSDEFDMNELMEEIRQHVLQDALQKKITFQVNTSHLQKKLVLGDFYRVKQVLINVINHAITHTRQGGFIDFDIEQVQNDLDSFAMYTFTIRNSQNDRFDYLDNAQNADFSKDEYGMEGAIQKSSNLGMTVTQKILESMGASIKISGNDKDKTFVVIQARFPLAYQNSKENTTDYTAFDATGKNILIVDDNEVDMEIVKTLLERTGADVTRATDGKSAIQTINESSEGFYHLVILDVQLPDMDGYEVAREIRCLPREDVLSIPMITLTSNASSQDFVKSIENGMSAHITKPLDVKELYHKVNHCLNDNK